MDDVFLSCRVPSSHRFCGCNGDAFRHANKFLRCCGLDGQNLGLEKLREGATKRVPLSAEMLPNIN